MIEETPNSKAIRVFYRKSDKQIVWTHTMVDFKQREGTVPFNTTVEYDLAELPSKMPDGETPLGGKPEDYACVELQGTEMTEKILDSDENKVVNGKVVIGNPRLKPEIPPPIDLEAELNKIKARLDAAGIAPAPTQI